MQAKIPFSKQFTPADKLVKLRIYYDLCIIKWFLNCISPNNDLTNKIIDLLNKFPNMDIKAMGFPTNWLEEELWQIK